MSENKEGSYAEETETKPNASERRRLQLDFSEKAFEKLNLLKEKADVKTNAELVRNSLRLYEWFLSQKEENARIQVVKGDEAKEVELIF